MTREKSDSWKFRVLASAMKWVEIHFVHSWLWPGWSAAIGSSGHAMAHMTPTVKTQIKDKTVSKRSTQCGLYKVTLAACADRRRIARSDPSKRERRNLARVRLRQYRLPEMLALGLVLAS